MGCLSFSACITEKRSGGSKNSQLVGLYQAFSVIEEMNGVSASLLMGGLKVSMVPTFYGIVIFMLSLILWIIMDYIATQMLK